MKHEIKNIEKLIKFLKNNYKIEHIDIIKNKIKIIVKNNQDRSKILEDITEKIKNSDFIKSSVYSSVGHVNINIDNKKYILLIKYTKEIYKKGIINEKSFVENIKKLLDKPKNIIFKSLNNEIKYKNIKDIHHNKNNKKNIKADVYLIDENNKKIPISIKKRNFSFWESLDSEDSFKEKIKKHIKNFEKNKKIVLTENKEKEIYHINPPSIWFNIKKENKKRIIFGNDIIENNGIVIIGNFEDCVFESKDKTIKIYCDYIFNNIEELKEYYDMGIMVFNNKTRRTKNFIPGLRIVAVNKKRITSKTLVTKIYI